MKCPVCGNDYRPIWQGSSFEQDGNTVTVRQDFFCPNCESDFYINEHFELVSFDPEPTVVREGDKSNFEPWLH